MRKLPDDQSRLARIVERACEETSVLVFKNINTRANLGMTPYEAIAGAMIRIEQRERYGASKILSFARRYGLW